MLKHMLASASQGSSYCSLHSHLPTAAPTMCASLLGSAARTAWPPAARQREGAAAVNSSERSDPHYDLTRNGTRAALQG